MAFYGYARLVDQLGDSYPGDRVAALDWVESEVGRALAGPGTPGLHPLVAAAVRSVQALGADPAPLGDLIAANRQDQTVARYRTFEDLLAYCRLSANPVGRLVLAAFSAFTPDRQRWSDSICTGLQLAEHWQDVAEDAATGRVYIPTDDLDQFDVTISDLSAPPPAGHRLRGLMAFEVARARRILDDGRPLVGSLTGRFRWAAAGFVAGGCAALDGIGAQGFDPLLGTSKPRPSRVATTMIALLWSGRSWPVAT
jgi:squalene synthase HpnC